METQIYSLICKPHNSMCPLINNFFLIIEYQKFSSYLEIFLVTWFIRLHHFCPQACFSPDTYTQYDPELPMMVWMILLHKFPFWESNPSIKACHDRMETRNLCSINLETPSIQELPLAQRIYHHTIGRMGYLGNHCFHITENLSKVSWFFQQPRSS